jgi:phosphoribosyl 1,2-cyclic phosphate phosphodiesterase
MLIRYLGTGAYEGLPALFCPCETCRAARAAGGRDVRTRSGALIDGVVKLDFPPDSYMQMLRDGLDFSRLDCLLVTHTHTDHYAVWDLMARLPGYASLAGRPALKVVGNRRCGELMDAELIKKHEPDGAGRLEFVRARPHKPVAIGPYTITAVRANHKPSEEALNYVVQKDKKRLLYAHDTGEFLPETCEFLSGMALDLVSFDCTSGLNDTGDHHMGLPNCRRVRDRLVKSGAARPGARFVLSHISHNSHVSHDRLLLAADGFTVAYDGMEIQI